MSYVYKKHMTAPVTLPQATGRFALPLDYAERIEYRGRYTDAFLKKYHQSLLYYKHFYDDINEYGDIAAADELFYFIPGFNGTAGQVKFGLPALQQRFGHRFYAKCLHLEEFSCYNPCWVKYNEANLRKRQETIVADLQQLALHGKPVNIIVSSVGFYDLVSVGKKIEPFAESFGKVYWLSAAPDAVSPSKYQGVFEGMNGLQL